MTQRGHLRWLCARKQLARFYDSIWFLPILMAFGAAVLFILSSALEDSAIYDRLTPRGDFGRFLIFTGSPSAARSVLGAIATGWATILGVVFSVTLVTVQLTASKYTAQMLSQFEKDKTNQSDYARRRRWHRHLCANRAEDRPHRRRRR